MNDISFSFLVMIFTLEGDLVNLRFHGLQGDGEERRAHVVFHVLVVERHDLDQTLQRGHLDFNLLGLSGLANDLHDEVPFTLLGENGI